MKKAFPLPSYVRKALRALNDAGYEAYVVGGAVRSWLLGTEIHDYDLTTSALPEEMEQVFHEQKIIETGIRHGTITVLFGRKPVEITTYRTETSYEDHRHPDQVSFTRSLKEDCARRDFTINALCYGLKDGLIDFYGGKEDLQNFLIRTVGDPEQRFEEDALRVLRALRFAAQLGFEIEPETREALKKHFPDIHYVSIERISSELDKILAAPYARSVLQDYTPQFLQLFPELEEYDESTWKTIMEAISRSPADSVIRMALLMDPLKDPERADSVLVRLKFSNDYRDQIRSLLRCSDMPAATRIDLRWLLNRLTVSFNTYLSFRCARDPDLDRKALSALHASMVHDHDCCSIKQLEVNGRDMQALGLRGEAISIGLNTLLKEVIEDQIPNEKAALMKRLKELKG
ncbi:MAG: CCA tRNA nucleotidyltransferase [Anaerolactibacter massiliensis]|nr:CCA tRNA nucleotidyltransferase [Anaerolactibacter massiliensis]MDY3234661.1 CCA tRNA nucleotidyltransferase [Erysipelotrichaceae bacterium]